MYIKKYFCFLSLHLFSLIILNAVNPDTIYNSNVASVTFYRVGNPISEPIIELNSSEILELSFDLLGTKNPFLNYTLVHCNADWAPSDLSTIEYFDSFSEEPINDVTYSVNTLRSYTHYKLSFPNQNIKLTKSGNYMLVIYEDNPQQPLLTRKVYIYENKVNVNAYFARATKIEDQLSKQELNFSINKTGYPINAINRLYVVIKQNGRNDNLVINPKPMSVSSEQINYENTGNIVFDGAGEFRTFDIKSVKYKLDNVERIQTINNDILAWLYESRNRQYGAYESNSDIDGKFLIKTEDWDDQLQAEYVFVNFFLKAVNPYLDGEIYVYGGLTDWKIMPYAKMLFNKESGGYFATLLLKQGYYNYQYLFVPFDKNKPNDISRIEGNHWETKNNYTIFVYYREEGAIADRLIAVKQINSLQKK